MKTKLVKRFYCEHCHKGGQRSDAMMRHESICFKNPTRCCLICGETELSGEYKQTYVSKNVERLVELNWQANKLYAELKCRDCTLAAIIQYQIEQPPIDEEDFIAFDYHAVKAAEFKSMAEQHAF